MRGRAVRRQRRLQTCTRSCALAYACTQAARRAFASAGRRAAWAPAITPPLPAHGRGRAHPRKAASPHRCVVPRGDGGAGSGQRGLRATAGRAPRRQSVGRWHGPARRRQQQRGGLRGSALRERTLGPACKPSVRFMNVARLAKKRAGSETMGFPQLIFGRSEPGIRRAPSWAASCWSRKQASSLLSFPKTDLNHPLHAAGPGLRVCCTRGPRAQCHAGTGNRPES